MLGHLLAVAGFLICLRLGWWQWDRFESPTGGVQNAAYALQWPVFGVFVLFFWYRALRDELHPQPRRSPPSGAIQGADSRDQIRLDEQADPELAAYNRYLAELNARAATK